MKYPIIRKFNIRKAADLAALTGPQLLELHNAHAKVPTKRFSNRATGLKRTWEAVQEQVKLAWATPAPETPAEKKTREMRFRFMAQEPATRKAKGDTLRARCELLLSRPDGATFEDVERLVMQFDAERNKETVHLRRRTYELIRLMHYALGHGLDDRTGKIKLVEKQKRLHGV